MEIRPISDLRNKFTEIEKIVAEGKPVYLTKNGYGTMVVMSLKEYAKLQDRLETAALKEADRYAEQTTKRMTHEEVYQSIRNGLDEQTR
ncbi:MAG: type II toxin-antitoxin system Phd/YefM family antitoxin [Erysipelotrichales bacterium]|nr:type II toxin-antitoxin system Phd/YefM family antitoxin [Erysipelotrichales bacterium]